ncbi:hypothetical protein B0H12DRAFT_1165683 [Mycena haematopus]|nr:hypothetical protein B0H12DRAFT_1165683 [Mycena haematopus]
MQVDIEIAGWTSDAGWKYMLLTSVSAFILLLSIHSSYPFDWRLAYAQHTFGAPCRNMPRYPSLCGCRHLGRIDAPRSPCEIIALLLFAYELAQPHFDVVLSGLIECFFPHSILGHSSCFYMLNSSF